MADLNLIVTPPKQQGRKTSSADQAILAAMAKQVKPTVFVSDGKEYKTSKAAGNEANVYRRSLARAIEVEDHKIVSRVWGTDEKGNVLADRDKPGTWRFALTVDPERSKRTKRSSNGAGPRS